MRYPGNWPGNISKDAKCSVAYSGGDSMRVRLIYEINNFERELLTTSDHPELVEMVNAVKEEHNHAPGGAFYINEYRHVVVPAGLDNTYYFAGTYEAPLEFDFEGAKLGAAPRGLKPGDPWVGPHVGIPYTLTAGANDIRYKVDVTPTRERRMHLSEVAGAGAAMKLASRLGRFKGESGGRIYINEARHFFAPLYKDRLTEYIYLGELGDDAWFPEPDVPAY